MCPYCAAGITATMCKPNLTCIQNEEYRGQQKTPLISGIVLFRSIGIFQGHPGVPASRSPTGCTLGVEYSLEFLTIWMLVFRRNGTTALMQFRSRGHWLKHDCAASCSDVFYPDWHRVSQHIYRLYIWWSMFGRPCASLHL